MQENGGRVNPSWNVDINNLTNIRGAIALTDIKPNTELLFCPWKLILGSSNRNDQMKTGDGMCTVVNSMAREIRLGEDSFWYPYLNHIELPRLAADWDGYSLGELQGLSPQNDVTRHFRWYNSRCTSNSDGEQVTTIMDSATEQSLVAFISRASDVGMVPIYDLLNHHNGKRNAKVTITDEGVRLMSVGDTAIQKGQEIFLSYGIKPTSTMFRDYGFIEDWPTCWNFSNVASGDNYAFVLFGNVAAINPTAEYLKNIWKEESSLSFLEYQRSAGIHTKSLQLHDLKLFALATRTELDRLPTTLQDDEIILDALFVVRDEEDSGSSSGDMISSTKAKEQQQSIDTIASVEYRMAFKRALGTALSYAEAEIESMMVGKDEL